MANRRASITDLAKTLGLSPSTISRALSNHDDVSEATKVRVRQLTDELHYQPNQLAAVGAMQLAKAHRLRVPKDIAFIGFSNELFTTLTEPKLSSLDQRCEQMGKTAVQLLQKMLKSGPNRVGPPKPIVLKPKLLVRESSQRL